MLKNRINMREIMFFLLGIFSTMQLLSIAGLTLFNICLLSTVFIIILERKWKYDSYFFLSALACLVTFFLSYRNAALTDGFRKTAITGGITYLLILILYLIMQTRPKYAKKLLKGFEVSCKITLIWCILQVVLYYLLHVDINTYIFESIMKIEGARSDYYDGAIIPSGFFYHRAILMPCFLYLFFSTSNLYLSIIIILVSCLTRSTALVLGLSLALVFRIVIANRNHLFTFKMNINKIKVFILVLLLSVLLLCIYNNEILEFVHYIIVRIADSTSNKADNSSVVHFLYYRNLIPIIQNESVIHLLFGTGFGTSGLHYTLFNGQYSNMSSWVVESDLINIFLNQGIIGFLLWGYLLARIVYLSKKYRYWKNIAFVICISLVGVLYNIQFTWFIIVEFAILVLTKNKIMVFSDKLGKKREERA